MSSEKHDVFSTREKMHALAIAIFRHRVVDFRLRIIQQTLYDDRRRVTCARGAKDRDLRRDTMSCRLRKFVCALTVAALTVRAGSSSIAYAATPEQVDAAVLKAQTFLLSQMKDGNCEVVPEMNRVDPSPTDVAGWQWGGLTAVATYGILASGVKPTDPRIAPAIEWLAKARIQGHYASAMRAQVWTFLADKAARTNSAADFRLLLNGMHPADKDGAKQGFYPYYTMLPGSPGYPPNGDPHGAGIRQPRWFDRSVSQMSVLGMWACEQAGQDVPMLYWQIVDTAWRKAQRPDGGWNYVDDPAHNATTATMTAAGVATLFITQDYLFRSNRFEVCRGGLRNEWIDRGLAWIDQNAGAMVEGQVPHAHYALYGLERIGVASGRKYFGTTDWYKIGADHIVRTQAANGSWTGEDGAIPDTVFCTLFLVRGRAPVVMSKLEYHNGNEPPPAAAAPASAAPKLSAGAASVGRKGRQIDPWNERPRDAANFAHWASRQTEQYLNWQVVNLRVPSYELHDAPILYIAGSEALIFNDDELAKLRSFVEEGGLILGNADGGSDSFSKSFKALGQKLFNKYEFRDLPANHSIFVDQLYKTTQWKTKPKVIGQSNGIRELMLLVPQADLGRHWQMRADKTRNEMFELMQNILFYAFDKSSLRKRGDTYIVEMNPAAKVAPTVQVARLMVGDNPDPEPGGWRRLAAILNNDDKIGITISDIKLGEGNLAGNQIAHLTGTTKFTLTDPQKKELADFVAAGGTLVVDAAGGSSDFANSAEHELATIFGTEPAKLGVILPPTHEIFALLNAKPEDQRGALYRKFAISKRGALNVPRLRGIEKGGRIKVFYSAEDLSAGLVGEPVDGILGYSPEAATDIMRGIVAYASAAKPSVPVPSKAR
jgi:hypothetical protein